jgi:hypothetical protein
VLNTSRAAKPVRRRGCRFVGADDEGGVSRRRFIDGKLVLHLRSQDLRFLDRTAAVSHKTGVWAAAHSGGGDT